MDYFLQKHLKAADRVEKGRRYFVVIDVECSDRNADRDKHYWNARELEKKGVSRSEIEGRGRYDCQSLGRSDYWGDRREEREYGLSPGSVASIQLAAVDELEGNHTFAVNCLALA